MKQTWLQIAKHQNGSTPASFELQVYKKLLELFHVGDYYYYIFNACTVAIEFVSDRFENIVGNVGCGFSVEWLFDNIHPDDKTRFIDYERKVTDFFTNLPPEKVMKYKVSYGYRLRCANGTYKYILQQVTTIQSDEQGSVIRVLGVHTDITHLKTDDRPLGLSFIGLEGEPSFHNVLTVSSNLLPTVDFFSKREKEVLKLVLSGKSSIEIAALLHISKYTVDSHRKSIFSKSACNNLVELGAKAIQNAWL
ncbi:LuxR C-terminal-related transcriptional regulator [Sphingobacterium alkalisoli]|nr:LuxR C-terminal-related transcriptional regulator [Sphingobacterium alkalisoli]